MDSIASERYAGISCHTCAAYSKAELIYVYNLQHVFWHDPCPLQQPKSIQSLSCLGNYIFNVSIPCNMCESHDCRLKVSISCTKDNFSCLTHKSKRSCLFIVFARWWIHPICTKIIIDKSIK